VAPCGHCYRGIPESFQTQWVNWDELSRMLPNDTV
jgi:hypothetical protein